MVAEVVAADAGGVRLPSSTATPVALPVGRSAGDRLIPAPRPEHFAAPWARATPTSSGST